MSKRIKPDRTLDCLGLYCPEPIFRTREEMDKLEKGQVLEITADDPAAEEDIKFWARTTGQEILDFKKEGYKITFLIRKAK